MLVDAGADVDARYEGVHKQTPLHWAASSDDVDALDALLDSGADIEAPGAFNGVGGPLDNAVGFGQSGSGPPSRRARSRGQALRTLPRSGSATGSRRSSRRRRRPPPMR